METINLSRIAARKIILNAAGLAKKSQFGTGIDAVYDVIEHLGFIQLDTNYVVERAHHHVLAARISDYRTDWLSDLVEDGRVFEYFTSDAGYIPMPDFRFSLPVKNAFTKQRKPLDQGEINTMNQVMNRIEREGPLTVGDFENDRLEASSGWWDWRPAKVALERLYLSGNLMVRRTRKFQKIYDLPRNFLPPDTDTTLPTDKEYAQYLIRRTLRALGIAGSKELAWRARYVKDNLVKKEMALMSKAGKLITVQVDGVKGPLYMLPDQPTDIVISDDVFILSPFDVLNVFRHRLKQFFDFDYQIECFVPAAKRQYGYFSLPILAGDKFIARMDAKADRKKKVLIVHNLHFEETDFSSLTIEKLSDALQDFMQFNQCKEISFSKSNRPDYLKAIRKSFLQIV